MKKQGSRSSCPIAQSLDIVGDKWSLLIIRDMAFMGKETYGDFQKSDEKIATNILASRLLSLEENEIITKHPHPESKAKVLYRLTEKGIDLLPVVVELSIWAEKNLGVPQSIQLAENQSKTEFLEMISAKLKAKILLDS